MPNADGHACWRRARLLQMPKAGGHFLYYCINSFPWFDVVPKRMESPALREKCWRPHGNLHARIFTLTQDKELTTSMELNACEAHDVTENV